MIDIAKMLFQFRICHNLLLADQAQGWVVADSEISARNILGCTGVHLEKRTMLEIEGAPSGTVFLTVGVLNSENPD